MKKTEMQQAFELLCKQLAGLREAYALETDAAKKLQIEHQIAKCEKERDGIEKEMEAIESLSDVTNIEEEASRIQFGLEVIIEKLQSMDNSISTMKENIHRLMRELGVRQV